ncbi:DNA-binding protein K10 isoform X2 [Culex quinquefasciatus]|uniref:DNA-binding protein K10 isoform X2 n=1 Tax=Culex quinquefasciatus TaxID=7176 RepID=UPI0018E297FD|nr:DNA-binding protein K10 isoform X2 [Culex quinquefasciatus]
MVATKAPAAAATGAGPQPGNKRRGGFHGGAPNRQRFKPGGKQFNPRAMGAAAMFTVNQLDDNPGFLDFNEDVQIPPVPAQKTIPAAESTTTDVAATTSEGGKAKGGPNRKANPNAKRFRNGNMRRMPPGGPGVWGPPIPPMPPMFPMGGRRNGGPFGPPPPHFRVPPMGMRGMRGGPMMPPPNGRFGPGPMPMMPPRPMMPMPPMRGGPMNWGGPNNWNGPPMRRNPNGKLPPGGGRPGKVGPKGAAAAAVRNGKGPKVGLGKKGTKSKEPAKPREEYPLDQPWVTDEIKAEHDKKVQLADRLKGNRDDALFAQFKEQRDKFVKMYDAAKLEFIGKHPEQQRLLVAQFELAKLILVDRWQSPA